MVDRNFFDAKTVLFPLGEYGRGNRPEKSPAAFVAALAALTADELSGFGELARLLREIRELGAGWPEVVHPDALRLALEGSSADYPRIEFTLNERGWLGMIPNPTSEGSLRFDTWEVIPFVLQGTLPTLKC